MICEFDYKIINCEERNQINITSVFWGREKNEERCISNFYKDVHERTDKCKQTAPQAEKLLKKIQDRCNKNQECDFKLPRWDFGDPCQDKEVSKYLNIKYDCIRKGEYVDLF